MQTPQTLPKVSSFRAECSADAESVARILEVPFPASTNMEIIGPVDPMPDVGVELRTTPHVTLEALRNTMQAVPDSHVMWQTLRELPLAQNWLRRDWNAGKPQRRPRCAPPLTEHC